MRTTPVNDQQHPTASSITAILLRVLGWSILYAGIMILIMQVFSSSI